MESSKRKKSKKLTKSKIGHEIFIELSSNMTAPKISKTQWSSIDMPHEGPIEKVSLSTESKKQRKLQRLLLIHDFLLWRFLIMFSILITYCTDIFYYTLLSKTTHVYSNIVSIIGDLMFFVDYCLALRLHFSQHLQFQSDMKPQGVFELICNGLTFLPATPVYYLIGGANSRIYLLLRSISFFRLYRVFTFFETISATVGMNHLKYCLLSFAIYFLVLQHTLACVWYMLSFDENCTTQEFSTWIRTLCQIPLALAYTDIMERYMICLYFSLSIISNGGYGDIYAFTITERVIVSISMVCGFCLASGFFVGTLSSIFVNNLLRKTEFVNQLQVIIKNLEESNMERRKIKYIMRYYNGLWYKKCGVQYSENINLLPLPLKMEIFFDVNYSLLQRSLIFRDETEPILRSVSLHMKHEFYLQGYTIYHPHIAKYMMICVISGVIEILSDEDNQSPIISFGPGTVIGEIALLFVMPAKSTIRAATYTELQVLYKEDFFKVINIYPKLYASIRAKINVRIEAAKTYKSLQEDNYVNLSLFVSQYEEYSPIKTLKRKLENIHYKADEKFYDKCLSLYNLKPNVRARRKKTIFLKGDFPCILNPNTSFTGAWDFFIFIIVFSVCILYPYFLAFWLVFPDWLLVYDIFVEGVYICDIIYTVILAIEEKNQTHDDFRKIFNLRMNTFGFFLDVVSSLYFTFLADFFRYRQDHWRCVFRLNRMFKGWKIVNYFLTLEKKLSINILLVRIIKYPIFLFLVSFLIGIILYMEACFTFPCRKTSWYSSIVYREIKDKRTQRCTPFPVTTVIYYAVSISSSVAYGDIVPSDMQDVIFLSFCAVVGYITFVYCIAEFSATFTLRNTPTTTFNANIYMIKNFLAEHRIVKDLQNRVINYCTLQWKYNYGTFLNSSESLLRYTPLKIKREVQMKNIFPYFKDVPFFSHMDKEFLQFLMQQARIVVLPPHETVCTEGDLSKEFYIIQEGHCEKIKENILCGVLGPKDFFGLTLLFMDIPCDITVQTMTYCKLICVSYLNFNKTLSVFPLLQKEVQLLRMHFKECHLAENLSRTIHTYKKKKEQQPILTKMMGHGCINVIKYCRGRNENYGEPFKKWPYLGWMKYCLLPICIIPDGLLIKLWLIVRILVALYYAIEIPYELIVHPYLVSQIARFSSDFICLFDLYLMLHVGYYGPESVLIVHPAKTSIKYLTGPFTIDLLISLPLTRIARFFMNQSATLNTTKRIMTRWFKLNKVLQIYIRLPVLFHYIKRADMHKVEVQIFKFLILILITINVCGCVLISTKCKMFHIKDLSFLTSFNGQKSNVYVQPEGYMGMSLNKNEKWHLFCEKDSWLDRSSIAKDVTFTMIYTAGFFWATDTLLGAGVGDFTPFGELHIILCTLMMTLGFFYFGYINVFISSSKLIINTMLTQYRDMMKELIEFINFEKVSCELKEKIVRHVEYNWIRTGGNQPHVVLAEMNTSLFEDVVASMYEKTLQEIPLFENVDRLFYKVIGKQLTEKYYLKGTTLVRANNVIEFIYIIYRGQVEILSRYNEILGYMGVGGIYGNITGQKYNQSDVTIIASRNVDGLYMRSDEFFKLIRTYPTIYNKINDMLKETKNYIMPMAIYDASVRSSDTESYQSVPETVQDLPGSTSGASMTYQTLDFNYRSLLLFLKPCKYFKFALPSNFFMFAITDTVTFYAAYLNTLIILYQFGFNHYNVFLNTISIVLDLIFILSMFFELHKGYVDDYGRYIVNPKKVHRRYFADWKNRLIEGVSNIPLSWLTVVYKFNVILYTSLRLVTLLRLNYIWRYYKSRVNLLTVNLLYLKISVTIIWITLICQVFACLWYFIACPFSKCHETSWIKTPRYENVPDNKLSWYITSLYYTLNLVTTTCNGDILPRSLLEYTVSISFQIASKFMIGVFTGDMMNILNTVNSSLTNYELGIDELKDYLQNMNVSEHQMGKISTYLTRLWMKNKGKQEPRLIQWLPRDMKFSLLYYIYGQHLRQSYIFCDTSEDFQRQLVEHFQHYVFFPGNYIVQHGDTDQCMYFIHRGDVEILTVRANLTESIHDVLNTSDMFGIAQGLYRGIPHHFSYRAKTNVNIICLNLEDWQYLLKFFPTAEKFIYAKAHQMYKIS